MSKNVHPVQGFELMEHESLPITTRPGLHYLPIFIYWDQQKYYPNGLAVNSDFIGPPFESSHQRFCGGPFPVSFSVYFSLFYKE